MRRVLPVLVLAASAAGCVTAPPPIVLQTEPPGSEVTINGEYKGRSPVNVDRGSLRYWLWSGMNVEVKTPDAAKWKTKTHRIKTRKAALNIALGSTFIVSGPTYSSLLASSSPAAAWYGCILPPLGLFDILHAGYYDNSYIIKLDENK